MLAMIKVNVQRESETTKEVHGMAARNQLKIVDSSNVMKNLLESISMKKLFFNWLADGNAKKYSVEEIIYCLDKISDYSMQKKISSVGIWEYIKFNAFKSLYNNLMETKMLRVTDRSTYKVFIVAGRLYLKFLKEKPCKQKVSFTGGGIVAVTAKEQVDIDIQLGKAINPEDVLAWAKTQTNAKGTLYLEYVVRQYMHSLHSAPMKLSFLSSLESRDVFTCRTVAELDKLWSIFKAAPNYKKVNSITSGMLSAGFGVYRRYLEYITDAGSQRIDVKASKQENAPTFSEILLNVLENHFQNGFRNNSPIEMRRFRRFLMEDHGEEVAFSDEELDKLILSVGTLFEGKVYIIQVDAKERIKKIIDAAFKDSVGIIFYSALYEQNEDWLFHASIISEKMLKNLLMILYPQFMHKKNYLAFNNRGGNEIIIIKDEILRVWGDNFLLSYEQLSKQLPYIPIAKIKYVLAQNRDFVWNSNGTYVYISKVNITDEECTAIADFVAAAYLKDGYSSLSDVPLSEIAERNYELSLTAVQNAVFAIVLADKYNKRGKIIIRKGDILDALSIMNEYCRSLEKCSLYDLLNFERELTGESHRWIPMEAGYATMIRADRNVFLAEKYIHFNVLEIDNVLDKFVKGNYLPIKSVTTFSVFPDCGQAWNLFLLESYCRRFSGRFHFASLAVNSKNAGVIVRKNYTTSYVKIMAEAVAASGVEIEKATIEDFLYSNGYTGRKSYAKADELIKMSKDIRKRRD